MAKRKTHIWRVSSLTWCGRYLDRVDLQRVVLEGNATCIPCLRARIDDCTWKAKLEAERAHEGTLQLSRVQRREAKARRKG